MAPRRMVRYFLIGTITVVVISTFCYFYVVHGGDLWLTGSRGSVDPTRNLLTQQKGHKMPFQSFRYRRKNNRRHSINILSSRGDNYAISPPFSKWESLHEIDFNIDRTFTFGISSVQHKDVNHTSVIPRIIHMMWTNDTVPEIFVKNVRSFVSKNPNWNFYFWTLQDGERLINEHYPKLGPIYRGYTLDVSRSDALRYILMYHYGGAYFDLDTECLRPLDGAVVNEECIISPEPMEHAFVVMDIRSLLATSALICMRHHELFRYVMSMLEISSLFANIMQIAGPVFLTDRVKGFIKKSLEHPVSQNFSFHVVSYELFFDFIKQNVADSLAERCYLTGIRQPRDQGERIEQTVCRHWLSRGGKHRNISPSSFTIHQYFGSYNPSQQSKLVYKDENKIDKIIPNVKRYPFHK